MPGHHAIGKRPDQQVMGKPFDDMNLRGRSPHGRISTGREANRRHDTGGSEQQAGGHEHNARERCVLRGCRWTAKVAVRSKLQKAAAPAHHECHEPPAAHDRVQRRGRAERQPCPGQPATPNFADRRKHERPRKDLRLAAADHPFAGRGRVPQRQREEGRRHDLRPRAPQQWHRCPAESTGQRQPAEPPADPGRLFERDRCRERPHEQVKHAVGVGGLEEKIPLAPGRVGEVPCLREVGRLVDIGHGPGPGGREDREDRQHFNPGACPAAPRSLRGMRPCRVCAVAFPGHRPSL